MYIDRPLDTFVGLIILYFLIRAAIQFFRDSRR